jgi:uncharacterized protein (TIGR03437 family)
VTIVRGAGFTDRTVVRWNGAERSTHFVNPETLEAALSITDIALPGRTTVLVQDPKAGPAANVVNVDTGLPPIISRIGSGTGGSGGSVAPGSIMSVYGENLSPVTIAPPLASPGQTLGGAIVEFKSFITHLAYPAQLLYVSPGQINLLVPAEVPTDAKLQLDVVQGTQMSAPVEVRITNTSPGLFSVNEAGNGQGLVFCVSDGELASPSGEHARPAHRGEEIKILATGLGPYFQDGRPATIGAVRVEIGGVEAKVTKSEAQMPFIGVYEVVAVVPENGVPSGPAVPIAVTAGGLSSNAVTIAVE